MTSDPAGNKTVPVHIIGLDITTTNDGPGITVNDSGTMTIKQDALIRMGDAKLTPEKIHEYDRAMYVLKQLAAADPRVGELWAAALARDRLLGGK